MPVYKLAIKIIKKNFKSFLIYFGLFLVLLLLTSSTGDKTSDQSFSNLSLNIAVIDRDNSKLSASLTDYLDQNNELVDLPDNRERLQDELFYRNVDYILFIDADFEEKLLAGDTVSLDNIKVPNSYTGNLMDMQVNDFIGTLGIYLKGDIDPTLALQQTLDNLSIETTVNVANTNGLDGKTPPYMHFFIFFGYIIIILCMTSIGPILIGFFRSDIIKRNQCSSLKFSSMNLQLAGACLVFSLLLCLFLNAICAAIYGDAIMFKNHFPFLLMNSIAITMVSLSITFLGGVLAKSETVLDSIANTVSLGLAFLGGLFVPQEIMSDSVLSFSRFLPTYWYMNAINAISGMGDGSNAAYSTITRSIWIQLGFTAAIFSVGLVFSKRKYGKQN